jgi:TolB protein
MQFASEHPNWSPDGKRVVFETDPPGGSPNIAAINPDGSGFTQLTFSNGPQSGSLQPAYSPDGTKIIFSRFRSTGGTDLFTMNPDGSGISRITSTATPELYPEWAVAN